MKRGVRATSIALAVIACVVATIVMVPSKHEWAGVDEAVIGRIVSEAGREEKPLIDWVQGDLLLFAFLCAGLLAGFVLGFYGRAVFGESPRAIEAKRDAE